ncbi:MAG TPA: hypothetical protein VMU17_01415 [Elusimicrobiota bacterium]|nr:hypothetical protein [Elusimicrobiota bacterium]
MDTLAHGLWGGAAFGQESRRSWTWAFVLGMGPDLFSFGPFFVTHLGDIGERWMHHRFGPPDPRLIPAYVYHAYNVTHSLVVWSILFAMAWAFLGRRAWPMAAWGLHILCDIPLHSLRFFPTPYLWPFRTPFVNGMPWGRGHFVLWNYAALGLTYVLLRRIRGRPLPHA